ncbi:helix-turn-helix domain-containing protein [Clostridioides difficile]|uniref:helix-turn-helix domain-containing protein n=1 Tax=Clostridioides difficile TaxID=1496 RepID=UPI00038D3100|nr:helix-turn-helix transcriptional regulator [Clostridioides difficile]EQJ94762.1 helix-turn-helix family protein [Clostridioides difficile P49]MBY1863274.1 helix-turn-helix domain-containing protein [Clostridioides difficile]MBZ0706767.1 helix-turn-helix domain-containing protein [Clostridioides difficile]MCH7327280.1 helix-turn-helix domain-containing protein [Clostridioides difficile]MCI4737431.1 helix-turn-helix domain-containing protein [Clostridioides difficile]
MKLDITPFGEMLRKIRTDNDEKLKDMSEKLNVTLSHLSAVETGKRSIPKKWLDILIKEYNLNEDERGRLKKSILHSATQVKINTTDLNKDEKELVFAFASRFKHLDNQDKEEIKSILKKIDSKELSGFSTRND